MNSFPIRSHPYGVMSRALLLACACATLFSAGGADLLPPGHRPMPPGTHALMGGKVVVKPGQVLEGANIIIRDGFIVAVGADAQAPPEARLWDMKGLTIYAGLIDPYLSMGATNTPVTTTMVEPIDLGSGINFFGVPGQEQDPGSLGPGYSLTRVMPEARVARSYSATPRTLEGLREAGFTSANVVPNRGILRGTSAFVALSDVNPNEAVIKADVFHHVAFDRDGGKEDEYPGSLMGIVATVRQSLFDAQHYAMDQSDYRQHPEGRKRPVFNPSLEALAPAVAQTMPVMFEPGSVLMVDRAARVARETGVKYLLVASGQEWRRPDLIKQAAASFIVPLNLPTLSKMPEDDDWLAVSLDQLRAWDWAAENPAIIRQQGAEIALTTHGLGDRKSFRKNLRQALDRGLTENDALAGLTTVPARLCGVDKQLGTIERGKIANLTVVEGSYFEPDRKVREVWIDGRIYPAPAGPPPYATAKAAKSGTPKKSDDAGKEEKAKETSGRKQAELRELQKQRIARAPTDGRGVLASPKAVLVRNATLWTGGAAGRIEGASLLVVDGKIRRVATQIPVSESVPGTVEIDGSGLHVTPGIIDCHSHSMILGGVNESTVPSSAMVRIGDVVNSETENIHQQLAGGVTIVNLLHGSANPIGGQNCVIKLREGASPEEMKLKGAPEGIKFALGENVKQSNWGDRKTTRFPQTRMGVPTFMANRFTAARQYQREWDEHRKKGGVAPRRDLELEAIGEILDGKRLIHCHSYRQDEIVTFLRVMEQFGVRVATLQHVLEGYKVADEIARHGAGGSCFSDWWGYKFEVYDSIPYGGCLMRERGVVVSFNSDSSDLARRLYLEAAKAVKYGGTPEVEAFKFVTGNPARQLRIDDRVGSLEPGKDGDFAIWSRSPLDFGTVCLQTWIEGRKYFDRDQASGREIAMEKERSDLLAKAKKVLALAGGGGGGAAEPAADTARAAFFQRAWEMAADTEVVDCQDCKITGRRQ